MNFWERRSRRLGIHESVGLDSLHGAAQKGEATARQQLQWLLITKVTGFSRHPRHFELAEEHVLEAAQQRGWARLRSAEVAMGRRRTGQRLELANKEHPYETTTLKP